MNKKISLGVSVLFACIVATVTFSITMVLSARLFDTKVANLKEREAMYNKLGEVDQLVRNKFFGDIDESKLTDMLATGYVSGLGDAYARYYSAEEYVNIRQQSQGKLIGVGIDIVKEASGYYRVTDTYTNSPAKDAGILRKDLIVKVGGKDITGMSAAEFSLALKGAAGSEVKLTVRRGSEEKEITMVRRECEITSVFYEKVENDGYIRIKQFNDTTADQFENALTDLLKQGVESLIFDLRNNGGGSVDATAQMLDMLLPEGNLFTATYKDGSTSLLYKSGKSEVNLPMVVLVNGNTASAAELFAASIRDYEKGKLVGTHTFGKGIMQSTYKLTDGSAVEFTVAKINPPSGVNFHGEGLEPNYVVELNAEQEKDFYSLTMTSDPQILKAIAVAQALKKG